ncbi:MAG: hypothetical protein WAW79_11925 [Steroidobacteraceae bacterium]
MANQLSDAERELVETTIVGDPDFRHEVELTQALRDGLHELHRQGEVAPLLRPRSWMWRRSPFAIAAAVLALAIGVGTLLFFDRMDSMPEELVVASLHFERTRGAGAGPDVVWQRTDAPTLLEMRFDVGLAPAPSYSVLIERIGSGTGTTVFTAASVGIGLDGLLALSIKSGLFEPGDYRIRLEPQPASQNSPEPVTYALRIAG